VPIPSPRTPICIARGNKADLDANVAALQEGEIAYAFDLDALFVKENGILTRVTGGVALVTATSPVQVDNTAPAAPVVSVAAATAASTGVVRWADAVALAAGTAGRAIDAAQLKALLPPGAQFWDMLQWDGTRWVSERRVDGGNF
jgi:hypothetical protein